MQQAEQSPTPDDAGVQKHRTALMRQRAQKLRNEATEAERALWLELKSRRLLGYKFRRQQPLGNYIVDFVCLEKRLIIEVDGSQHFDQSSYDEARTHWLESQGYRVLRFLNNEVLAETKSVIEAIIHHLED